MYKEDSSKNNKGGIKGRKIYQKEVVHHENTTDTQRCPVMAYRKYISLLPDDCSPDAFYFMPLKKPKPDCWYTTKPLGHNSLDNMVKKMYADANITGYKTNHSLRATTATRLYHAGVDEQLIMERTGHRSLDGVRRYKRTSDNQ